MKTLEREFMTDCGRHFRRGSPAGFTIVEVAVTLGLILLILAVAVPFYGGYRGRTSVNRSTEITKAVIERAAEEAKAAGYPLPQALLQSGLEDAALAPVTGQEIIVKAKKRVTPGGNATLLSERHLPRSDTLKLSLAGLGVVPPETTPQGVFVEIVQKLDSTETLLATIPIDVNGEFVFFEQEKNAAIFFNHRDHTRGLQLNIRGVITADQR